MISADNNTDTHNTNGVADTFAYTFRIFETSDLEVVLLDSAGLVDQTLVLSTDYTVTGAGSESGGNVVTTEPPATGYVVRIRRAVPYVQEVELAENDSLPAATLEDVFDRFCMWAQQLSERVTNFDGEAASALPRSYLAGLGLANGTDTEHDINIAVGAARADDNSCNITLGTAIVKQLDAAWAVGTNAGGIDTGTIAASKWYFVWLIKDPSTATVDVLLSLSATSPTMPTGYTKKRRIGAVLTNGSANIIQFRQTGDEFLWYVPGPDVSGICVANTLTSVTLDVPTTIKPEAICNVWIQANVSTGVRFYANQSADITQQLVKMSTLALAQVYAPPNDSGHGQIRIRVGADSKVKMSASDDISFKMATLGWIDRRGRDD